MTENEWIACHDLYTLLQSLGGKITDRKFRLFGSACCRRIWELLDDDRTRRVVEIAEQAADGNASLELLGSVWYEAYRELVSDEDADAAYNLGLGGILSDKPIFGRSAGDAASGVWFYTLGIASAVADYEARSNGAISCVEELPFKLREQNATSVDRYKVQYQEENRQLEKLLRDIFINPFRPVAFDPRWRTEKVLGLARGIYEDRAFDRLPLLADALMDAGCEHDDILAHCRGDGPHVRGCWVVDLVLGKE